MATVIFSAACAARTSTDRPLLARTARWLVSATAFEADLEKLRAGTTRLQAAEARLASERGSALAPLPKGLPLLLLNARWRRASD
jgi:hypothetical protein